METLFDETPPKEAPLVRCIECAHFEGSKRDAGGFLFRHRQGYCEIDDRPGGRWGVLEDVDRLRRCPHFLRASEELIKTRKHLLSRISDEAIKGKLKRFWR